MTQSDVRHGVMVKDYRTDEEKAPPWCEQCNLQEDICRCHDDAIPGDVAAALLAKHSAAWCERLSGELSALLPEPQSVLAWQMARLSPDELAAFARQLVAANESQCDKLIDACIAAFELQPQRQRATELAAVVEVERRRHFVLELQKAINAVIDGVLRRTQ